MAGKRRRPRVGYFGPEGTFTMVAAERAFPGYQLVPYNSIPNVFRAVRFGKVAFGIVPIYNSLNGAVLDTERELLNRPAKAQPLYICGEVILDIVQCLMARPGMGVGDIKMIFSHNQSLGQCSRFIRRLKIPARGEFEGRPLSNAAAVDLAMAIDGAAAIGPERCAQIYGAAVLKRNIANSKSNRTRFLAITTSEPEVDHQFGFKTSIAFSVPDKPGSLVKALEELTGRGFNLTRVEERPYGDMHKYYFLVDFNDEKSSAQAGRAKAALRAIERMTSIPEAEIKAMARNGKIPDIPFYRFLGTYPEWKE